MFIKSALAAAAALTLAACASTAPAPMFSQASLPAAVKVPAGHKVVLETVGVGEITYECRDKKDAVGQTEWVFVGPDAKLLDRDVKQVGKYYGPPATWEAADGSKFTGAQLAVAPAPGTGNIPLQLVKANPAMGMGAMQGVTYVQRVNTSGGMPPVNCEARQANQLLRVNFTADFVFYRPR